MAHRQLPEVAAVITGAADVGPLIAIGLLDSGISQDFAWRILLALGAVPRASLAATIGWTLAIFAVAALPGYLLAAATIDRIGRRALQAGGFAVMAAAFLGLWLIPGATTTLLPFLLLFGATYFFAEFGPNTTTFVYPAEIFPVRVRTTSHGIAAAAGKVGAFIGVYSLAALLPAVGLSRASALVAGAAVLGLLATVALLPEPKGVSLQEFTEDSFPRSTAGARSRR
jgi:sugar phosphate permease